MLQRGRDRDLHEAADGEAGGNDGLSDPADGEWVSVEALVGDVGCDFSE